MEEGYAQTVPDEIICHLVSYLDLEGVGRFASTASRYRLICSDEKILQQAARSVNRSKSGDVVEYDRYTAGQNRDHIADRKNRTFDGAFDDVYRELRKAISAYRDLDEICCEDGELSLIPREIGELRSLTALRASGGRLSEVPREIGLLTNVTYLNLGGNRLASLPDEIGLMESLEWIVVQDNRLIELPRSLSNLTRLRTLDASKNRIRSMEAVVGIKSLEDVYLGDNEISEVPKGVESMFRLDHLDLSDNRITSLEGITFGDELKVVLDRNPL